MFKMETEVIKQIPQIIIDHASAIVKAPKPADPALKGFEPLMMAGLSAEHLRELDDFKFHHGQTPEQKSARFTILRQKYAGDPLALEQIDMYDPTTDYHKKLMQFRDALKARNAAEADELYAWLREHYPQTHRE